MFKEAADKVGTETQKFITEPNVLGKFVVALAVAGVAGGLAAIPIFSGSQYSLTVSVSLAIAFMSSLLVLMIVVQTARTWNGGEPMRMWVPRDFNELLTFVVALLIGIAVSLSIFR